MTAQEQLPHSEDELKGTRPSHESSGDMLSLVAPQETIVPQLSSTDSDLRLFVLIF